MTSLVLEARARTAGACTPSTCAGPTGEIGSADLGAMVVTGTDGNPIVALAKMSRARLHRLRHAMPHLRHGRQACAREPGHGARDGVEPDARQVQGQRAARAAPRRLARIADSSDRALAQGVLREIEAKLANRAPPLGGRQVVAVLAAAAAGGGGGGAAARSQTAC